MELGKVHLSLFFVSLFYAILFSWAGKIMPNYLHAEGFVWIRIAFAGITFHALALFFKRDRVNWKSDWKEFAICGFFGTSANMYLFFAGLERTYPINGAVLMLFTPLFVAIFDHIRVRKWPKWIFLISLSIAAFSSVILIGSTGTSFNKSTLLGDLFIAVNAIFYAVYLVRVKSLTQKYKPLTINRWTFTFGLIFISPLGIPDLFQTQFGAIPNEIWIKIAYILIFTSFLVYLLNAYAVQKAGPTLAGIYIYLQPLLATIIAFILNTDKITWSKCLLILTILVSTYIATKYTPKKKTALAES